jgi:hypothetical protein
VTAPSAGTPEYQGWNYHHGKIEVRFDPEFPDLNVSWFFKPGQQFQT